MRRLAGALLLFANSAFADQTGAILGQVVDKTSGAKVAGAKVVLKQKSTGEASYRTTTDSEGLFRMEKVNPGTYVLEISAIGFKQSTSTIDVSEGLQRDLGNLELAALGCGEPGVFCDSFDIFYPIHAQGTIKLALMDALDIDEGRSTRASGPDSDLSLRKGVNGEIYFTLRNHALAALNPRTELSKAGCMAASYSADEIRIDGLAPSSRVCIRTSRDRFSQITFDEVIPLKAKTVQASFITWQGIADEPRLK